jgi:hypothetical protein
MSILASGTRALRGHVDFSAYDTGSVSVDLENAASGAYTTSTDDSLRRLRFVLCTEPATGRTSRINPGEFAFQLLTPLGVSGGRLGEFALQLLGL